MPSEESRLPEEILKSSLTDIARLRELGVTDYAIVTYMLRVREGRSKERALHGLLQGRTSLTREQRRLVRTILDTLPIRM